MIPLKDNIKSRHFPVINISIILANAYVFYRELTQPSPASLETFISTWSLFSGPLLSDPFGNIYRLFTHMFLHGGWMHLIGNTVYLWIFGDNVEDRLGHLRYFIFYLLTGSVAAVTQIIFSGGVAVPMLGASGAIAGVMGAYFVLYPMAKILTAVPIFIFLKLVEIPAIFFLGLWFIFQSLNGYGNILSGEMGGVAWWAHAGGFLSGLIFVFFFRKSGRR